MTERGWYTGVALAENPSSTVAILPVGTFATAKYGKVALEEGRAQRICENFNAGVLTTDVRIDIQHYMDEAAGWIVAGSARLGEVPHPKTGEDLRVILVDVEWTPVGAKLLGEKQYRYVSAYIDDHKDPESGKTYHDVLKAVALCNDPVMRMLPPVELETPLAACEALVFSEALGDVVDELRRREAENKASDTPPELRAATWGGWTALTSLDTLVGDAIRSGLTGDTLASRIRELCADLPAALLEAISNDVDAANAGDAALVPVAETVPQVDPTEGGGSPAVFAEPTPDELVTQYDTLMDSLAGHVKGAKGVRMMRELAKATRAQVVAILGQKGVTEKMSDESKEALELAERERDDALTKLAERTKLDREAAVEDAAAILAEKGVAQPAIDAFRAIASAEDTSAIRLSEGGDPVDLASALKRFAENLEVVPVKAKTAGDQPNPDDGKVELSETRKEIQRQLRTESAPTE